MTMLMEPLLPRPTDPVSQPIINSPFHPPQYHWNLDSSTKAWPPALDGRREAQNIPPVAGSRKLRGRLAIPGQLGVAWTPLKLVNDIRKAVVKGGGKGLLKKSAPVNAGEKRAFNVVESREIWLKKDKMCKS